MAMNHSRFSTLLKPMASSFSVFRNASHSPLIEHFRALWNIDDEAEHFSLVGPFHRNTPCNINNDAEHRSLGSKNLVHESWRSNTFDIKVLTPGVVLLKRYITMKGQVDIINICRKWGERPQGFYQPRNRYGNKLRLHMMCFGQHWDPITKYEKRSTSDDGSEPPPLPHEFTLLAESIFKDVDFLPLPSMQPNFGVANFYDVFGRLGLHQDCDETQSSIERGLPVVSISIGDDAEFLYGHTREENKLESVYLETGDVLLFGGEARLMFHGVRQIFRITAPPSLLNETNMCPGRLSLTLRQV